MCCILQLARSYSFLFDVANREVNEECTKTNN